MRRVWDRIVSDALDGSQGAQKLVLEYSMSKISDLQQKDEGNAVQEYRFYVVDSRGDVPKPQAEKPIDGEFRTIPSEENQ